MTTGKVLRVNLLPLRLPRTVWDAPQRDLSETQRASLVETARRSYEGLVEQIEDVRKITERSECDLDRIPRSIMSADTKLDLYDWFFLVERVELDTEAVGIEAILQVLSDYLSHTASECVVTDLEEASIAEAIQAILENYGAP